MFKLLIFLPFLPTILLQTTDQGCNCVACKYISAGEYAGTYSLTEDGHHTCSGSCLYTNTETGDEVCMCDPGDVKYTLSNTCTGTNI